MASQPEYTVFPTAALKSHTRELFDALKAGKIVYVSKHGKIRAAFLPYGLVPAAVAKAHASPNLDTFSVSSADSWQGNLAKPLADAEAGLPSIVEKDRDIYGMLVPASAPRPVTIPDPAKVGAKAEAMREFRLSKPEASVEDVVAFSKSLDAHVDGGVEQRGWPLSSEYEDDEKVEANIASWREAQSAVEEVVEHVFKTFDSAISVGAMPKLLGLVPREMVAPALVRGAVGGFAAPDSGVERGELLEAAGDEIGARAVYVMSIESSPVGAMWRLANQARRLGRRDEAARWSRLTLAADVLSEHHSR